MGKSKNSLALLVEALIALAILAGALLWQPASAIVEGSGGNPLPINGTPIRAG